MIRPNTAYLIGALAVGLLVLWWLFASEGYVPDAVRGAEAGAAETE